MGASKKERARLRDLVQYLNLEEMRTFCRAHDLPMHIHIEVGDKLRRSRDRERKDVVLDRILVYALEGRREPPTVYVAAVCREEPLPPELTSRTRLHYGQYDKSRADLVTLLKGLTDGAYRHGMITRLVLRDFWTAGQAPTLAQLAKAWLGATAAHTHPRPEGAYLVDLARGEAGTSWKNKRIDKAREALAILAKLT